jgi:hypothetical protein
LKKKVNKGFKPTTLKPKKGCSISVAEHQGKVEVVLESDGQMCRLLVDQDGIHVGTVVCV